MGELQRQTAAGQSECMHSELSYKRLDRGRFVWPQTVDGVVALSAGQMSYLLEGIDWRHPQQTWRPQSAG
jgi:transposase